MFRVPLFRFYRLYYFNGHVVRVPRAVSRPIDFYVLANPSITLNSFVGLLQHQVAHVDGRHSGTFVTVLGTWLRRLLYFQQRYPNSEGVYRQ